MVLTGLIRKGSVPSAVKLAKASGEKGLGVFTCLNCENFESENAEEMVEHINQEHPDEDGGEDEITMTESDMALHDAIAMVKQLGGTEIVLMPDEES